MIAIGTAARSRMSVRNAAAHVVVDVLFDLGTPLVMVVAFW